MRVSCRCLGSFPPASALRKTVFHRPGYGSPGGFSVPCEELWKLSPSIWTAIRRFRENSPVFHPVFHSFHRVFHHSTVDNSVESVEKFPAGPQKPDNCADFSIRSKSIHMRFMISVHAILCKE